MDKDKLRKTSIDLEERTYMQLKYIAMAKAVSLKSIITKGALQMIEENKDLLPKDLQ